MLCSAKEVHVQNTLFFHLTWIKTALISASYSCYADSVRVKVTTYHWKAKKTRDFDCFSEHQCTVLCVLSVSGRFIAWSTWSWKQVSGHHSHSHSSYMYVIFEASNQTPFPACKVSPQTTNKTSLHAILTTNTLPSQNTHANENQKHASVSVSHDDLLKFQIQVANSFIYL